MSFFNRLSADTRPDREALTHIPIVQGCLAGRVSLPSYIAFLNQAYHHVRHTVPLLQAVRVRLPARLNWMRADVDEYIAEETGHDQWILDDLEACGVRREDVSSRPGFDCELMVAYAYDTVARVNPLGFFGMVHVLEGTSVALALSAADRIQSALALPPQAFRYLRSHGTLDQEHVAHFALLMDRLDDAADREAVVHAAKAFYRLYGNVFRSLPLPVSEPAQRAAA